MSEQLRVELARPTPGREPIVFGLVREASAGRRDLIFVRELIVPPNHAFLPSRGHGAQWRGAYTIELLNRALASQCGLFIIHGHGADPSVRMSRDDRDSAAALLPKFQLVQPKRTHGSLVFGDNSAAGMLLRPGGRTFREVFETRFLGSSMTTLPRSGSRSELEFLRHQPLTANPAVGRLLRNTTVAVFGLSGGGSQVVPHLATLGVGKILGVDPQRVGISNRYATNRFGWLDVLLRRRKTAVMRGTAWWLNPRVSFEAINATVPDAATIDVVKRADVVVGCFNNLHARADVMELCWRYCVPYVDIGFAIRVASDRHSDGPPPVTALPGSIFVGVPGNACMWCTDYLTKAKLAAETGGLGRSYLRDAAGDKDAWVLGFNGVLASQAANEVLQLLVGYTPQAYARTCKRYDGLKGTMQELAVRRQSSCDLCKNYLAVGDPLWS